MNTNQFDRLAGKVLNNSAEIGDTYLFRKEFTYRTARANALVQGAPPKVSAVARRAAKKLGIVAAAEEEELWP